MLSSLLYNFPIFVKIFSLFAFLQLLGSNYNKGLNSQKILQNISLSIPITFAIYTILWIVCLGIYGLDDILIREKITKIAFITTLMILLILKLLMIYKNGINKSFLITNLSFSISIGFLAVILQILSPKYMVGDSYYLINWSSNGSDLIQKGFPLIGLSISNLSLLISNDLYLFTFHNIIGISIIATLFSFLTQGKFFDKIISKFDDSKLYYLFVFFILFFYIFNGMFLRHFIYVNFHLFTALLIFSSLVIIYNSDEKNNLIDLIYLSFFLIAITFSRMEGVILSTIILWVALMVNKNKKIDLLAIIICLINAIYLFSLREITNETSFVNDNLISILILIVIIFYPTLKISNFFLKKTIFKTINISAIIFLLILLILKPFHMLLNILIIGINLNPFFWGIMSFVTYFMIILITKNFFKKNIELEYLVFLYPFVFGLLSIIILSYFRSSLRLGMNDSANRMIMHIIPLSLPIILYHLSNYQIKFKKD